MKLMEAMVSPSSLFSLLGGGAVGGGMVGKNILKEHSDCEIYDICNSHLSREVIK